MLDITQKIREYLKRQAPYSVVDRGIALADQSHILECSKTGNRIIGSIKDDEEQEYSVYLDIISASSIEAGCTCCSSDEIREQWCSHAVALLWHASNLDFFAPTSGFSEHESTYRMNTSSPAQIAEVLREVERLGNTTITTIAQPKVDVQLDLTSDRMGIKVFFDGNLQTPTLFESYQQRSGRSIDNLFLQTLDLEGSWDEEGQLWYLSSSKSIEICLGFLNEYERIVHVNSEIPISYASELLQARIQIEWQDTSAELVLYWITPTGELSIKGNELFGTGPFWTVINNKIYKLSALAARLASIFPYSSTITIPKAQMGAILQTIADFKPETNCVTVLNPSEQPTGVVKDPTPVLDLERKETHDTSLALQGTLEIQAQLEFEYPAPGDDKDIIILPNLEKERCYNEQLQQLGFVWNPNRRNYKISGDAALDLVSGANKVFSEPWKLQGLEAIQKSIRFAELQLNVAVSSGLTDSSKATKKIDWFDCHITLEQNSANVPLSLLFKNLRADTDRWIMLDSGAYARVPGGGINQLKATLGMIDPNFKLSNSIKTRLGVAQAVSISRVNDSQFNISLDKNLKILANKLQNFDSIARIEPSKEFVGKLRPYQSDGLSWLNFLNEYGLHGILADEMGLGKTVQAITLLQKLYSGQRRKNKVEKPSLIVAPTSVITNWMYEVRRFAPNLKILLLHGVGRKQYFSSLSDFHIVVTSYALLRMDRFELEKQNFAYLILDEAQNIKNPLAATSKAAKALKADNRLALSGTPTENRPLELWSLMDFLMPGYLGSIEFFRNQIEKPILELGTNCPQASYLNSKTKPFILRRLKSQVEKDLPAKTETTIHSLMSDSQRDLYNQILEEVRPKVFKAVAEKGIRGASVSILAALLRLRQICNHPNSIEALKHIEGYESGKFEAMKELVIEALESNRKILLFSQFREMLSIIRNWLEQQKINHLYLDGTTKDRQGLVDKFNSDDNIRLFLISLKAGGTGLNLTGADTVIIYDPWWNPAVEVQAVDRAHRIGQTKAVSVYRLVTENSIEQKIMDLKSKKASLVDALINENGLSNLKLTKADLESFFSPLPSLDYTETAK